MDYTRSRGHIVLHRFSPGDRVRQSSYTPQTRTERQNMSRIPQRLRGYFKDKMRCFLSESLKGDEEQER